MNYARPRRQAGMTLIEVMVSITVGLILLSGVISIFSSNKLAYRLQESTNVLDENARYALNQLQYHLRMGDHWGGVEPSRIRKDATLAALAIASTTCTQSIAVSNVGFFALEGASSSPLSCIPNADYQPNTDVLIVRYAGPDRTPSASIVAGDVYLRTRVGAEAVLFKGSSLASLPSTVYETPEPVYEANWHYMTVIYFIRKCASQDLGTAGVCDAADDTTPTLTRLVLSGTSLVQEDVVAGVEQLQATFGKLSDAAVPKIQYYAASAISATDWPSIVNVQVSMIVRGTEYDVTHTDGRSFKLYGGFDYTPVAADRHYGRKQYNFSVQIRNTTRG
ncbi:MAG: PilW family protein [Gammaproteobacteria bacterium]|jgi:prepilin-type N-terminal cleavage/methylation domain-containing protein|nr:PilW family protein [Gammaproteobacteria bacterium]